MLTDKPCESKLEQQSGDFTVTVSNPDHPTYIFHLMEME